MLALDDFSFSLIFSEEKNNFLFSDGKNGRRWAIISKIDNGRAQIIVRGWC